MTETALRGLSCASDSLVRVAAAVAIRDAGYELVAETGTALDALRMAELLKPDLVVIDNDLTGQPGIDWIPEIAQILPMAAILLIANDPHILEHARENGAFGVVYKTELSELEGALRRARAWLGDPDLRRPFERRTGQDRRQDQVWTQVTSERRSGTERRRRDEGPPATDAPDL